MTFVVLPSSTMVLGDGILCFHVNNGKSAIQVVSMMITEAMFTLASTVFMIRPVATLQTLVVSALTTGVTFSVETIPW